MAFKSSFTILSAFLLLHILQVGSASNLQCYVCQNCAKITAQTELATCDESYFNKQSTSALPSVSTTELSSSASTDTTTSTTVSTTVTTTTEEVTSTPEPTTTVEITTEVVTTVNTTTGVPVPSTVGPLPSTTALPTPPNVDVVYTYINASETENVTNTEKPEIVVRQRRHAVAVTGTDYTYHCYSVQRKINNTLSTDRGCTRVTTPQNVCSLLKTEYNEVTFNLCRPCTMSRCNGSSMLSFSVVTIILGIIATWLHRN